VYLILFFLILVSAKRQIDPHWITVVEEKKKPQKREKKNVWQANLKQHKEVLQAFLK
jgi:hypothetical protein